jgi:lysophospholipase L1-like esterase
MRARGRLLSCLVTMVFALAGFVTAGTLPAAAAPSTIQYVALGDSYAAGTAIHSDCPSPDGYPTKLADSETRIELTANAACSGAKTSDVIANQVAALDRHTRLVTLTVGAANLGLSAVLAACFPTPNDCGDAISNAHDLVRGCPVDEGTLGGDLIELYGEVAKAAPGARIVVTGYPLLFGPPADPLLDPIITRAINEATTDLNCVIERAVAATQATYANIHYVDVTDEFAEYGIVTRFTGPDAFIHSLFTCDPRRPECQDREAFHPTPAGYLAYADAIKSKLPNGWLDNPLT